MPGCEDALHMKQQLPLSAVHPLHESMLALFAPQTPLGKPLLPADPRTCISCGPVSHAMALLLRMRYCTACPSNDWLIKLDVSCKRVTLSDTIRSASQLICRARLSNILCSQSPPVH